MKISHNGEEWHGTFGLTLRAMVDDLLSDGVPIGLRLTLDEPVRIREVEVERVHESGEYLIAVDGEAFDVDRILAAEVL